MISSPKPRYDRIVSLVLLVLLGLVVVFLIDINPNILRARIGGDLPVITVSWLLIASLVVITITGVDVSIRSHPQMQSRQLPTLRIGRFAIEMAPDFWVVPSLVIVSAFAFGRLFSASLQSTAWILAIASAGVLLFTSLIAQHYVLDRRVEVSQQARFVLQIISYVLAFLLFSAVYYARMRTLYSAALIGAVGALLAYPILQQATAKRGQFTLALLVGLLMGEATWALNYWAAPFLLGGALLLVLFYIATSLLQHHLEKKLSRNLFWEYGLLGSGLLAAVVYVTFR